jgi:hypothetical protein
MKYKWSDLNHLQVGKYSEYFAKMAFTLHGFEVYTSEVDDHGVDFLAKKNGNYIEVQVKSLREGSGYAFMAKSKFDTSKGSLYLALVLLKDAEEPNLYLINAKEWLVPNELLKDRTYEGKKSPPEWGVNISGRTESILQKYQFDVVVNEIH